MSTSKARDLPAGQAGERRGASARSRFLVAATAGAVVAVVAGAFGLWELAPLLGWDTAALTYLAWTYATVSHLRRAHSPSSVVSPKPADAW